MGESDTEALYSIENFSRSFALASRFFNREQRLSAAQIYRWCRFCDDIVDEGKSTIEVINQLRHETDACWNLNQEVSAVYCSFRAAVLRSHIPSVYAQELLSGMEMDLQNKRYKTFTELKLYCYRVASTVGLMMCHVMGIFNQRALEQAASLGMAMQLTNICRDVKADLEIGRLYLPLEWLNLVGLNETNYFHPCNRKALFNVVEKVLDEAEGLYQKGLAGTRDLPWRSALAVLVAARVYREIGREIVRRGSFSLEQRTVVGTSRKWMMVFLAIFDLILTAPHRIWSAKKNVPITETWIYPC